MGTTAHSMNVLDTMNCVLTVAEMVNFMVCLFYCYIKKQQETPSTRPVLHPPTQPGPKQGPGARGLGQRICSRPPGPSRLPAGRGTHTTWGKNVENKAQGHPSPAEGQMPSGPPCPLRASCHSASSIPGQTLEHAGRWGSLALACSRCPPVRQGPGTCLRTQDLLTQLRLPHDPHAEYQGATHPSLLLLSCRLFPAQVTKTPEHQGQVLPSGRCLWGPQSHPLTHCPPPLVGYSGPPNFSAYQALCRLCVSL